MITDPDVFLFLGILLAMGLSKWPKQAMIGICALAFSSIVAVDFFLDGWAALYLAGNIQIAAFLGLVLFAIFIPAAKREDKLFYIAMLSMFVVGIFHTWAYVIWKPPHAEYVLFSRFVDVLHVILMLGFADGCRNLMENIGRRVSNLRYHLDL